MIKKIKWNNHKVLGNLELDFSKSDGSAYNTIVLAGENGTGKTTILETLSTFLNLGSIEPFEYINYIIDGVSYTITPLEKWEVSGYHSRTNDSDGNSTAIRSNRNNNFESIGSDPADIRHYGVSYSKARSGFSTKKVTSTTTKQIDSDKYESDTSEDFTSIKQLLIDISAQDNAEWMNITKSGIGTSFTDFQETSKIYRFETAFNNFFDCIKFKKIDNNDSQELRVLFEKHGKEISVDSLSTGEKQIVFRGAHLLKNINSMFGGIVLIDEPELSMHPKWQQKILQYYRNLFNKDGVQNVQIIMATHSEYVLRSALEDRDNVLITAFEDNNGPITPKRITAPTVLPSITSAETNYIAFGIISSDYHIELYGYLQNIIAHNSGTTECTVKQCDDYIVTQSDYDSTKHYKPSSHTNRNGSVTSYSTLPTYIRNAIDHPDPTRTFTQEELKTSIELLIKLCI